MEAAVALAEDEEAKAELYGELAFQTLQRVGMWGVSPPADLIDGWVERALASSCRDGAARAKALVARSYSRDFGAPAVRHPEIGPV